jgi:hypothetical protein
MKEGKKRNCETQIICLPCGQIIISKIRGKNEKTSKET